MLGVLTYLFYLLSKPNTPLRRNALVAMTAALRHWATALLISACASNDYFLLLTRAHIDPKNRKIFRGPR